MVKLAKKETSRYLLYIACYPDAVPDNSPYELFDVDDAKEAIGFAREILDEMKKLCQIQKS